MFPDSFLTLSLSLNILLVCDFHYHFSKHNEILILILQKNMILLSLHIIQIHFFHMVLL